MSEEDAPQGHYAHHINPLRSATTFFETTTAVVLGICVEYGHYLELVRNGHYLELVWNGHYLEVVWNGD